VIDWPRVWDAKTGQALHTLNDHTGTVWSVAFSSDGQHLETNNGTLLLPQQPMLASTVPSHPPVLRICIIKGWVTADSEEMLWLPVEYRQPSCIEVHKCQAGLGYQPGKVLLFDYPLYD